TTTIFLLLVASAALTTAETSLEREINQVLSFVYHVGDSERAEERNEEEVKWWPVRLCGS
ncbi:hypothetical protein Hamer_G014991, partial [Homarus americanus]